MEPEFFSLNDFRDWLDKFPDGIVAYERIDEPGVVGWYTADHTDWPRESVMAEPLPIQNVAWFRNLDDVLDAEIDETPIEPLKGYEWHGPEGWYRGPTLQQMANRQAQAAGRPIPFEEPDDDEPWDAV